MALDGVTIANIVSELKEKTLDGRIDKIFQPEKDEVIINIRCQGKNLKLLLTASASHPRLHLSEQTKPNPANAPLFCMVLRKHLSGGKIVNIIQPNFERIVEIHIESLNELGDLSTKKLIIEIMGKHSNIILTDINDNILDCVKHVTFAISTVRQVLPGGVYVPPPNQGKLNPLEADKQTVQSLLEQPQKAENALFVNFSGVSPILAREICFKANVDANLETAEMSQAQKETLSESFIKLFETIKGSSFNCNIFYDPQTNGKKPVDFSSVEMTLFNDYTAKSFESVSLMLEFYYGEKDLVTRYSQKTVDIRKLITQNLERCAKKRDLYNKTLKDIADRDKLKVLGELLTANIYSIEKGMDKFTTQNYYDENLADVTINLDKNLTPAENAQRYYKKYNKQKRTFTALQQQILQNDEEYTYLESLLSNLSSCEEEADIEQVKDELIEAGFSKKRKKRKGLKPKAAKPLHFMSSDGIEMFVGKNNKQNDELTMKFAENGDYWFHVKDMPGSHVIVRTGGKPAPESTLNEAAQLAAFYSKGKNGSNISVDFTTKKNVKKPNGAKPGMVIYDNYKTAYITPDEDFIKQIKKI